MEAKVLTALVFVVKGENHFYNNRGKIKLA